MSKREALICRPFLTCWVNPSSANIYLPVHETPLTLLLVSSHPDSLLAVLSLLQRQTGTKLVTLETIYLKLQLLNNELSLDVKV